MDGITVHLDQFWTALLLNIAVFMVPIVYLLWKMHRRPPREKGEK